ADPAPAPSILGNLCGFGLPFEEERFDMTSPLLPRAFPAQSGPYPTCGSQCSSDHVHTVSRLLAERRNRSCPRQPTWEVDTHGRKPGTSDTARDSYRNPASDPLGSPRFPGGLAETDRGPTRSDRPAICPPRRSHTASASSPRRPYRRSARDFLG